MQKLQKPINLLLALILCLMAAVSIADTEERHYDTAFDQTAMRGYIDALTTNGPRSIYDTEENGLALDYIRSLLESWGLVQGDRTDAPAFVTQRFVTGDGRYQSFHLDNIIVHIPANAAEPSGEALMFMGHTDSVPMGQGASDDGVAVATMLEAIRTYTAKMAEGYTLTNDLVFCFVNGEEFALYGSEAFMAEFTGFDRVVDRIRFGVNLESRGTSGTLIMFETAANNYNTVKLFSEINENVFTCSIATMIYDMMPNGTDFSSFKEAYQGLNFANLGGGENYHTQNDDPAHLGDSYLSQNAMIVDAIIDKLGNYDLDRLHDAEESAIFFSYLNLTTVVYSHATAYVIAAVLAAMVAVNVWLNRKRKTGRQTAKGFAVLAIGLALTAGVTWVLYYVFQYLAVLFGSLDVHAVGSVTFSNVPIVIGIGLTALAVATLTVRFSRVSGRDILRAFAYLHAALGAVLSVVLPDASYLFAVSGLLFMAVELLVNLRPDAAGFRMELLATALYMPIIMPVLVLATSALGLTMAWLFGMIFALGIFGAAVALAECRWSQKAAAALLTAAMVLFLTVSAGRPDANVNLTGKQNLLRLSWDDALVCAVDGNGEAEWRVYDLNAARHLKPYAPELRWNMEYYVGESDAEVSCTIRSTAEGATLTVREFHTDNLIWLTFTDIEATSFTIDNGVTSVTHPFEDEGPYTLTLHSDCTVTIHGGSATVEYREVLQDYAPMIPAAYQTDPQRLHFNLWLTAQFRLVGA